MLEPTQGASVGFQNDRTDFEGLYRIHIYYRNDEASAAIGRLFLQVQSLRGAQSTIFDRPNL